MSRGLARGAVAIERRGSSRQSIGHRASRLHVIELGAAKRHANHALTTAGARRAVHREPRGRTWPTRVFDSTVEARASMPAGDRRRRTRACIATIGRVRHAVGAANLRRPAQAGARGQRRSACIADEDDTCAPARSDRGSPRTAHLWKVFSRNDPTAPCHRRGTRARWRAGCAAATTALRHHAACARNIQRRNYYVIHRASSKGDESQEPHRFFHLTLTSDSDRSRHRPREFHQGKVSN